ncbi:MAG: LLM class F420-dependent oxidoreductase [candidate division NC10 bacterium]
MKYGAYMFSTDYAIRPDDLARGLEERGFESLWLPEHTHIPASRKSPWPGGGPLPREYWHTLDPFVALGAAAAVTTRLKLATGICLVIERDPITLAKEVASLDWVSRGRVIFGIGGGWNAEEMANHGTAFESRWKLLRERIEAMKAIWTQDEAEYHGTFVHFDKLWAWPKPVQRPYPPIVMGGSGPHARQRAVDFDGHWMPIVGRDPLDEAIADLKVRAETAGRDPATVTVSLFGASSSEGKLAAWRDLGVARAVFSLPSAGRDTVLPLLDRYAAVAARIG